MDMNKMKYFIRKSINIQGAHIVTLRKSSCNKVSVDTLFHHMLRSIKSSHTYAKNDDSTTTETTLNKHKFKTLDEEFQISLLANKSTKRQQNIHKKKSNFRNRNSLIVYCFFFLLILVYMVTLVYTVKT